MGPSHITKYAIINLQGARTSKGSHPDTTLISHTVYSVRLAISGVVEGERRSPKCFLGNAVPRSDIRTRGTVILHGIR